MALTKLTTDLIDGSLGTDWQATPKTANFPAVAGEGYFVDTTSAAITVTLPSSPNAGDEINLVDYAGTANTNNITIISSDNINGSSNDVKIDYERGGVSMVYVDATQGWIAYNAANETATGLVDVPSIFSVDYLVIAGGGGGGAGIEVATIGNGGGAGAGGLRTSYGSVSGGNSASESSLELLPSTNYTVTVGAGGSGSLAASSGQNGVLNTDGSDSVFSTITSDGGGKGACYGAVAQSGRQANSGGSGGGGAYGTASGAAGTSGQGFNGGNSYDIAYDYTTGGGGGAGASGGTASAAKGGDGGNGLSIAITGSATYYAGGGGGGNGNNQNTSSDVGAGGSGGGGIGAGGNNAAGAGTPNTGGGGGGAGNNGVGSSAVPDADGGNGGSGVVILRYPNTKTITIGAGLTGSTATDGSDKVTTFTAGTGTISFS